MALFHLSVTQTKRSAGQSAIASAAMCRTARWTSDCMQAGRSFHARLFPRRSIASVGLRIRAVHGAAGECQSLSLIHISEPTRR